MAVLAVAVALDVAVSDAVADSAVDSVADEADLDVEAVADLEDKHDNLKFKSLTQLDNHNFYF